MKIMYKIKVTVKLGVGLGEVRATARIGLRLGWG